MRSIAVLNQKGGVGKTTTAVNLSAALARAGQRVCLIDFDPQAHATLHLGLMPGEGDCSIYDVLVHDRPLADARKHVAENLWVVGSHIDLAAAEVEFVGLAERDTVLRKKLAEDRLQPAPSVADVAGAETAGYIIPRRAGSRRASDGTFDYVLIDCPPSLGILTLNALAAVDEVILPLQPHFLALHGLSKLLQTIDRVSRRLNPQLKLTGVVLCLYESATRLAAEVAGEVSSFLDTERSKNTPWSQACIFESRIRRNVRLAEAPSFGQSIFDYAADSNGAEDYRSLGAEVLQQGAGKRLARSA